MTKSGKRKTPTMEAIRSKPKSAVESTLEQILFGGGDVKHIPSAFDSELSSKQEKLESGNVFFVDSVKSKGETAAPWMMDSGVPSDEDSRVDDDSEVDEEAARNASLDAIAATMEQAPSVWHDEEDEAVVVDVSSQKRLRKLRKSPEETELQGEELQSRMREQYEKLHPVPKWASRAMAALTEEEREVEPVTTETWLNKASTAAEGAPLKPEHIDIVRLRDANAASPSNVPIQALDFHPSASVLLTGGLDRTLRLFQIDGQVNAKIQSVHFKDLPIFKAEFSSNGQQVVAAGRRPFFYVFDVAHATVDKVPGLQGHDEKSLEHFWTSPDNKTLAFGGRDGSISLVSPHTKQWFGRLKMNSNVSSVSFSSDGRYLFSTGELGHVYQWDTQMMRCVSKFADEGALRTTALAMSPNDAVLACGADSGVVNLYDPETCLHQQSSLDFMQLPRPRPRKSLMNLTTHIDSIQFNHDSQLMGYFSRSVKNAFRLVHISSGTVFSNWPTAQTPLNYVTSFSFDATSRHIAVGNDKGKVLLYKLQYYR